MTKCKGGMRWLIEIPVSFLAYSLFWAVAYGVSILGVTGALYFFSLSFPYDLPNFYAFMHFCFQALSTIVMFLFVCWFAKELMLLS